MQFLQRMRDISLGTRLALVSFLFNLSIFASLIYLPLYASDLGASRLQVGLIAASYGMAYFVSAFLFGRQADIHGRLAFIRAGLVLAAVAYVLQIMAPSPIILLVVRGAIGFCLGVSAAAIMAYAYESAGRVGSFTSFGSLGWLCGSLAAAALRDYEGLFIVSAVGAVVAFLISLTMKEERHSRVHVAALPLGIIWENRRVYLPFLLRHMGATSVWAILPLYLAGIGASLLWIAILNAINTGGQFIAMRIVQRFNPARLFALGLLFSIVVFTYYGMATHYLQLIPIQFILALSWSCLLVGALTILLERNVERGTAVGLLYSTDHLAWGLGPFLGGAIAEVWGFETLMFVAAGLSLAGLLAARGVGAGGRRMGLGETGSTQNGQDSRWGEQPSWPDS